MAADRPRCGHTDSGQHDDVEHRCLLPAVVSYNKVPGLGDSKQKFYCPWHAPDETLEALGLDRDELARMVLLGVA